MLEAGLLCRAQQFALLGTPVHPCSNRLNENSAFGLLLVWRPARTKYTVADTYSPYTPLWDNPNLSHFCTILNPVLWARHRIRLLEHIMPQGTLLYCNALWKTQLLCEDLSKLLSALYSQLSPLTLPKMTILYHKWQADIFKLTADDWEDCVFTF